MKVSPWLRGRVTKWMVPVASLTNFPEGRRLLAMLRQERRIVTNSPRKTGANREWFVMGVINRDSGDLFAVFKAIDQTLQLAIRMARDQRLGGSGQAFRQHLGVILQIALQPKRIRAGLEKREGQGNHRDRGD